jgi:hypothetical protein
MKVELSFWDMRLVKKLARYTINQDGEAPDEKAEAIIEAAFPGYHIHGNPKRRKGEIKSE